MASVKPHLFSCGRGARHVCCCVVVVVVPLFLLDNDEAEINTSQGETVVIVGWHECVGALIVLHIGKSLILG